MKRCKQSSRAMRQRTTAEVHTRGTSRYALKVKARRSVKILPGLTVTEV